MGLFSKPKKRRSPQAILNALNRKLEKKAARAAKVKNKATVRAQIAAARKKLRGY
jgi:hypothetical protein